MSGIMVKREIPGHERLIDARTEFAERREGVELMRVANEMAHDPHLRQRVYELEDAYVEELFADLTEGDAADDALLEDLLYNTGAEAVD